MTIWAAGVLCRYPCTPAVLLQELAQQAIGELVPDGRGAFALWYSQPLPSTALRELRVRTSLKTHRNRCLQSVTIRGILLLCWRVSVLTALTSGDVSAHFFIGGLPY